MTYTVSGLGLYSQAHWHFVQLKPSRLSVQGTEIITDDLGEKRMRTPFQMEVWVLMGAIMAAGPKGESLEINYYSKITQGHFATESKHQFSHTQPTYLPKVSFMNQWLHEVTDKGFLYESVSQSPNPWIPRILFCSNNNYTEALKISSQPLGTS